MYKEMIGNVDGATWIVTDTVLQTGLSVCIDVTNDFYHALGLAMDYIHTCEGKVTEGPYTSVEDTNTVIIDWCYSDVYDVSNYRKIQIMPYKKED